MLGKVIRATAFALHCFSTPAPERTALRTGGAQVRFASRESLDRLRFAQDRTALVLSLWACRPARQCAVAARYDEFMSAESAAAVAPRHVREAVVAASPHVRALQQRLAMTYPSTARERPTVIDMELAARRRAA